MMQLQNNDVRLEFSYYFDKEIKISNCLLARFNDNYEKIQFATQKLTLFAYENDLELTGETYTVVLHNEDNNVLADVFMPIKQD